MNIGQKGGRRKLCDVGRGSFYKGCLSLGSPALWAYIVYMMCRRYRLIESRRLLLSSFLVPFFGDVIL